MASKVAAAKIASWSGVRAVIAAATRQGVLADAVLGTAGVGTVVRPRPTRMSARKLWIAFAVASSGRILVDEGAQWALTRRNVSLLPAGVVGVEGSFAEGDAVEIVGPGDAVFAKGLARISATDLTRAAGRRSADLPDGMPIEAVHRDDLVIVP